MNRVGAWKEYFKQTKQEVSPWFQTAIEHYDKAVQEGRCKPAPSYYRTLDSNRDFVENQKVANIVESATFTEADFEREGLPTAAMRRANSKVSFKCD